MTTKIYCHPDIFLHDRFAHHEVMKFNRIETIYHSVATIPTVGVIEANSAELSLFELFHSKAYLSYLVTNAPKTDDEQWPLDDETVMNRYTLPALALSVGAVKMAIDDVYDDKVKNSFCPVYPGHHALPDMGMGFCFTNTVAIGARYAAGLGYKRIAVADFDTHSGNGTIVGLKNDEHFLFTETYQAGFPGRALLPKEHPKNIHQVQVDYGENARLSWQIAWRDNLLPKIKAFRPEIILLSAGFDAHRSDPLGMTQLEDDDYVWLTHELLSIQPRIVSVLEGGYSLLDTARCARLHVETLADNHA